MLFAEPLRGFEDYPFYVDRIGIGSARYRLPIIIDHGWASTLWVLPALFIQQIDFELFAVGGHRRPPGGAGLAHRRGRLAVVAPAGSGSSRSPSSTSWRAASPTIRRWCT